MRRPAPILIAAVAGLGSLCLLPSCKPRLRAPGWVQSAPADSVAAFSGEAGWVISHPEFQSLLAREPMADRALDLFLQKARINPRTETGRLTFHVIGLPQQGESGLEKGLGHVLIQLDQFKDPKSLVAALTESFPQEGHLRLGARDWPLYVILDLETGGVKAHIRAASDEQGQIWIGELSALQRLASGKNLATRPGVAAAAEWISPRAPFQGYLQPEALLGSLRKELPDSGTLRDLPKDVQALLWSVTPGAGPDQPSRFELSLAGSPAAISQVTPWLQRLVAAISAVQPVPGAPPPELLQEKGRVGLRAALTDAQLKLIMEKLGQPGLSFGPLQAPPKA
ncbi:MAG TPA: hypothetical protein VF804_00120 [Holophagaceae bacterium]